MSRWFTLSKSLRSYSSFHILVNWRVFVAMLASLEVSSSSTSYKKREGGKKKSKRKKRIT